MWACVSAEGVSPRREFGWGLVDQVLASATTLTLTIAAGRVLGPSGLGVVAIGYAAFLIVLGLNRSLVADPLVTRRGPWVQEGTRAVGAAVTLTIPGAAAIGAVFVVAGTLVAAPAVTALASFGPWLAPAATLSMLRSAAFRSGRGKLAAAASSVSLAVFVTLVGSGLRGSPEALVASWGLGAVAGGAVLLLALRVRLSSARRALWWFRAEAFPLGRWLGATSVVAAASLYALTVGLAHAVGTAGLGGYRAVESAFSAFSLVAVGVTNPGIAAMKAADASSSASGLRLAVRLGAAAAAATAVYSSALALARGLVFQLFGPSFRQYGELIVPIAVGQTLLAASLGFLVLLKVRRQGRDLLVAGALAPVGGCVLGITLGFVAGIDGAAWGIAASALPPLVWSARRSGLTFGRVQLPASVSAAVARDARSAP